MTRVLVVSPGVLPLPPVLGGAVENMITRLHPYVADTFEMEYVSVGIPEGRQNKATALDGAPIHYVDSIDPLTDFTPENQFELNESGKSLHYQEFCQRTIAERRPAIVHVHNEAYLLPPLRGSFPDVKLLLHVNDEVVTRMKPDGLGRLSRSCDLLLACSQHISHQVTGAFDAASAKAPPIDVFYNFVDSREYDPEKVDEAEVKELRERFSLGDDPVIVFVGRMIEEKGPHLLLKAFRRLLASQPRARLLFVGAPWYSRANSTPFAARVQAEAASLDRVHFAGYVSHEKMPAFYALASVVCAPSIWDDPSPFVAYEAQSMAKPVLATTRGGLPEIVEDRVTGRCIDVFNTILFAGVLEHWLAEPNTARRIGQAGRRRVLERFDIKNAGADMLRRYQALVPSMRLASA